jgi:hypothetical protein
MLEEQPDIDLAELASTVGCSVQTAQRARTLYRQARAAEAAQEATDTAQPLTRERRAVELLREMLSKGPAAASDVEKLAERQGIGPKQLERARGLLGIRVERRGGGVGVVYLLPNQAQPHTEAAEA